MKIAVLSYYNGIFDRGVEVATTYLVKGFSNKHEVALFQAGEREEKGIKTEVLGNFTNTKSDTSRHFLGLFYLDENSLKIALFTLFFLKHFFSERYDIVIPTNGGWQVLLIRIFTWLLGKKMVVQGNAGIGRDDYWQLLCQPNHYVSISPQGYEWAKKKALWVKMSYIPHGVEIASLQKTKPIQMPFDKPIVLCVAAFVPYKRIDLLVRAMEKIPEAALVIIGQGPEETHLRELGKSLLGNRFLLKNNVTHNDLFGYYKSAKVFSLPSSSSEALGIVYIEAMAAGVTIVAPDDKNRRSIIGNAGYYVDVTNAQAYAEKIKEALRNSRSAEALVQAQQYDWSKIVTQYERVFNTL